IAVVLRDRAFVHGRAEVGRVRQVLGIGVIRQKAETAGILPANIYVTGVVPTLRRIFEQIDCADRERLALDDGVGAARREYCVWNKTECLERTARAERAGSRRRVMDQVRALQVQSARAEMC